MFSKVVNSYFIFREKYQATSEQPPHSITNFPSLFVETQRANSWQSRRPEREDGGFQEEGSNLTKTSYRLLIERLLRRQESM